MSVSNSNVLQDSLAHRKSPSLRVHISFYISLFYLSIYLSFIIIFIASIVYALKPMSHWPLLSVGSCAIVAFKFDLRVSFLTVFFTVGDHTQLFYSFKCGLPDLSSGLWAPFNNILTLRFCFTFSLPPYFSSKSLSLLIASWTLLFSWLNCSAIMAVCFYCCSFAMCTNLKSAAVHLPLLQVHLTLFATVSPVFHRAFIHSIRILTWLLAKIWVN